MAKLKVKYPRERFYPISILRQVGSKNRASTSFPRLPELWGTRQGTDFLLVFASPAEIQRELERPEDWTISRAGRGMWFGKSLDEFDQHREWITYIDADGDEVEDASDILRSLGISPDHNPVAQLERMGLVYR